MHRTVAVVAALCVLSPIAVATNGPITTAPTGGAPAGPTTAAPATVSDDRFGTLGATRPVLATPPVNTTAYLTIAPENVTNTTTTESRLDVGGAIAVEAAAANTEMTALSLDERLSRANTTAAKQVVIRETGESLERRIARLDAQQRTAIERYSEGESSTREFVYTLARLQVRAESLRRAVDRLDRVAASVPGTTIGDESIDSWARDRRVELGIVTSPVRERVVGALRGTGPIDTYIEVSDTGVVLAAVDRGQYFRDAYLPAERDGGPPDGPDSTSEALERVIGAYPWAWNHSTGVESAGGLAAGSYRLAVFHQQGRLITHLDPRTGAVFREIQAKPLHRIPTTALITSVDSGLRVGVERTYATGPMNVTVVDAANEEPVNATVLVDNRTVGRTGSEGSLWTVTPRGQVNLTVTDGERTAAVRFAADPRLATGDGEPTPGTGITPLRDRPITAENASATPTNGSAGTENTTVSANGTDAEETVAPSDRSTSAPDPESPSGR